MMKYIYKCLPVLLAICATVGLTSCEDDDRTGESLINPTSPSISINLPETVPPLVEQDTSFTIEFTLSEPQVVDVPIYLKQVGGDMVKGEDYNMPSQIRIPKGETVGTAEVTILTDDMAEETETLEIQIGDDRTANASIEPVNFTFTITNSTTDELDLALSWSTPVTDPSGAEVDATDVADLRLIFDPVALGAENDTLNGSGFEEYTFTESFPDGTYSLLVNFVSIADLGDFGDNFTVDLTLDLFQVGKVDQSLEYLAALNTEYSGCDGYYFSLGTLTKSGNNYSFERAEEEYLGACSLTGAFNVQESGKADYEVNLSVAEYDPLTLVNDNFWNEGIAVEYVIDQESGVVTIPSQEFEFDLDGEEGAGEAETLIVEGSGTYDIENKTFAVDYTVKAKDDGEVIDDNTNTFTGL